MKGRQSEAPFQITRRQLLAGVGAATIVGSIGTTIGLARPVAATELQRALPAPSPIPGGVDAPPVGFIHIFTPGPEGSATPYLGLPGEGLDVEPGTITNFQGFTAYAVLAGQAEGRDGKSYNVEFDMRVMDGEYIAEDGSNQHGVFALF
jgi:hypothetical protein